MQFEDIYALDNCECLIDEIGSWMPNHKHKEIPEGVRRFLAQDRREGVNIHWTHRTTRVFHEVLDNTAEIAFCQRWGPLIIVRTHDPEEKDARASREFLIVNPGVYHRYDTFARVGSPEDAEGYGQGKRKAYASDGKTSAFRYKGVLETVRGTHLPFDISLNAGQAEALIRSMGRRS